MMGENEPRDHHYVPQFYLRSFAIDDARQTITTVAKEGVMAIWKERSIKGLGYERDFYVHLEDGVPVSVETDISRHIETPISESDTWRKIVEGRSNQLDETDRPILYALVRHLETRTPHALETIRELAQMAADPNSKIPFTDYERERYAEMRNTPGLERETFKRDVDLDPMARRRFLRLLYDGDALVLTFENLDHAHDVDPLRRPRRDLETAAGHDAVPAGARAEPDNGGEHCRRRIQR